MDIEQLREYCLSLPAVTEDVKWEALLCFMIGGKMFCTASLDEGNLISFKVPDEDFERLTDSEAFMPAPYFHRAQWVRVVQPQYLGRKDWERYITQSYELVRAKLTKKQRTELGL
jgi:predicted DNA-binding protein (MmcQ/YjbR family)